MENDKNIEIKDVMDELRSVKDQLKQERENLDAEKRALEQERAAHSNTPANENRETVSNWRSVVDAMKEKRTVSLQGTGAIAQMNSIWDLIKQREPLLDQVSYFRGPNSKTQIALLNARPAIPSKTSTAANTAYNKNYALDNTQLLKVKEVAPYAWTTVLPVDYDTVLYSFTDVEARIPALIAESFRTAMCNGMFTGDGSNSTIKGIFAADNVAAANKITTASATAVSLKDLLDLALAVKDMDIAEPVMVMEPAIYSAIAAAEGGVYDFVKEELVRNKSIEGVKVVLSGKAPSFADAAADDIVVWCGDLKNYAFAVADEVTIETVKQVGDSNTYFQAIMSFTGDVIEPRNVFALVKKSAQ